MTLRMNLTPFERSWLLTWGIIAVSHGIGLLK